MAGSTPPPYSMRAFVDETEQFPGQQLRSFSHASATLSIPSATSQYHHERVREGDLSGVVPHDPQNTRRVSVTAGSAIRLRSGTVMTPLPTVFSKLKPETMSMDSELVMEGVNETLDRPETDLLEMKDVIARVEVLRSLTGIECDFLGMPDGKYHVGMSLLKNGIDGTEQRYGPLLYHLFGARSIAIHDLAMYSSRYGPPFKPNIETLFNAIGTPDEEILLSTIRQNCVPEDFMDENEQAKLMVHLSQAFLWRTGRSSEIADIVQMLNRPAVRQYIQEHGSHLLPDAKNFWEARRFNLERKLVPDPLKVEFAAVHTRRYQTVILQPFFGQQLKVRVKDIAYGNTNAVVENCALHLMALTGLAVPAANIGLHADSLLGGFDAKSRRDYEHHQDNPERFCIIASPLLNEFKDLGLLLIDKPSMHNLVDKADRGRYDELLQAYATATERLEALVSEQPIVDGQHPQLDLIQDLTGEQLGARQGMFKLLPQSLQDETARAEFASMFVGNWDFVNRGLANFGVYVEPGTGKLMTATLDFGNSLLLGFGGQQKHQSWIAPPGKTHLNEPALIDDPRPEKRTGTPNLLDPRWVGDLGYHGARPPAVVPKRSAEDPASSSTAKGKGKAVGVEAQQQSVQVPRHPSFSTVADTPRTTPIAMLIEKQIRAETFEVGNMALPAQTVPSAVHPNDPPKDRRVTSYNEKDLSPFMDAAYRLSLIPDEAIMATLLKYWPWQGGASQAAADVMFPWMKHDDRPGHTEMTNRVVARRDELVSRFDVEAWAKRHPQEAAQAYNEVFAAVLGSTNVMLSPAPWMVRDDTETVTPKPPPEAPADADLVQYYGIRDPITVRLDDRQRSMADEEAGRALEREGAVVPGLNKRLLALSVWQGELENECASLRQTIGSLEQDRERFQSGRIEPGEGRQAGLLSRNAVDLRQAREALARAEGSLRELPETIGRVQQQLDEAQAGASEDTDVEQ